MSDSESSSDCSSESSDNTFDTPTSFKGSATVDTGVSYDSDSSEYESSDDEEVVEDSDDDSDDSDDSDVASSRRKRTASRCSSVGSADAPEGISEEAMSAFFSKDVEEEEKTAQKSDRPKAPRTNSLGLDAAEKMMEKTKAEMAKRKTELSATTHSMNSAESILEEFDSELDDVEEFKLADDISIEEEAKKFKEKPKDMSTKITKTSMMRNKRDIRMAKVRDRIRKKEEEKEKAEDEEKEKEMMAAIDPTANLDMSEGARRERAYAWYTRMAMPTKSEMKERLETMSVSAGVTVEDIDLMPWNASGKMVNVGKMQRFINAGFKKKFTRKNKKAADSDSDSD